MTATISRSISAPVGQGGINRNSDVLTVQQLINENIMSLIPLDSLAEDGLIGSKTIGAIVAFQQRVVQLNWPDGRVDPGGRTITTLNAGAANSAVGLPAPTTAPDVPDTNEVTLTIKHGNRQPTTGTVDGLYESQVELAIQTGVSGDQGDCIAPHRSELFLFRGSIYPDNMNVKGRVRDGTYDLNLGFHRRSEVVTENGQEVRNYFHPTPADVVAREQGFRAALIVQQDGVVPCISDNPAKVTSQAIHVHNGFRQARYSDGCQTIHPSDWLRFIQILIDRYPNFSDWSSTSNEYLGRRVGSLVIQP